MNWKKETVELKKRRSLAKQQGGDKAIDLQHAKGRLTLRERIDLLLDKGSFQEQGEIAGGSETNEKGEIESLTPANFILGFGKISGKQVVVGGEDEGYTEFTKDQFELFCKTVKEGAFDRFFK